MSLTQCAACATELGLTLGKKCGRCSTRYCGPECQVQHWKEGGHDQLCKKIKKGGGAEQYHAEQKFKEAVAVAVKACADDTMGQACFICTQALHWKTKEGLVRGCSCRGTAGFAHVSCLVEQAKILYAEAEENNLDVKVQNARLTRWEKCSLCEQQYHGFVKCALGWGCWKTYVGRPETDEVRGLAMTQLGNGLNDAERYEEALTVEEALLSLHQRLGETERNILAAQNNLATTYHRLGRFEQGLRMRRDVYTGFLKLFGIEHDGTLSVALNFASTLLDMQRFKEARSLLREIIPVGRRFRGDSNDTMLKMRWVYAKALYKDDGATLDGLRESVVTFEDLERTARRVLGGAHPTLMGIEIALRDAQAALRARQEAASGDVSVSGIRKAVEAMTMGDA